MYEIYRYRPNEDSRCSYNIRNTDNNHSTGCCSTLSDALICPFFDNVQVLSVAEFEDNYGCKLVDTTHDLEDFKQRYPELFI